MTATPDIKYSDRQNRSNQPSWRCHSGYVNEEHLSIFEQTRDIPGWQAEGDTHKLYEMAYFAGDVILEIGTYCGRSAVVELKGAVANKARKKAPQFFGIDTDMASVKASFHTLSAYSNITELGLLYHGDLEAFFADFPIRPTMVFIDGNHLYEGVKKDLALLSDILTPGVPVLCHDYTNKENDTGEIGVRRAVIEWETAGFVEFYGVFGCSALLVATHACRGQGIGEMDQEEFLNRKGHLLKTYGLTCISPDLSATPLPKNADRTSCSKQDGDQSLSAFFVDWLESLPKEEGLIRISEPRPFAHDEAGYDKQYAIDPSEMRSGIGLMNALKARGADFSLPALEMGCGTGKLSLGLVKESCFPLVLLSDPSVAFLNIVRSKLKNAGLDAAPVHLLVLTSEEINRLPSRSLSLIVLRSTLHHILDVNAFIHDAGRLLTPNGFLMFEEPCMEGYVLMGALAQFIPLVLKDAGIRASDYHESQIATFVDAMRFYARRDIDKRNAEDKHLFRPDELTTIGKAAGFSVEFIPNTGFEACDESGAFLNEYFSFHRFFIEYLKYCMGFDAELIDLFERHFEPYNRFIEEISAKSNAPYCYSVFLCRKLGSDADG